MNTLPIPVTLAPVRLPRLKATPIFFNNVPLSLFSVMMFPDDLLAARRLTARLLINTLRHGLDAGCEFNPRYLSDVLEDLKAAPERKLVERRFRWGAACGQATKLMFALINSNDERVRKQATWNQAIKQVERVIGRQARGKLSSLHVHMRRNAPVLHFHAAFQLARDETAPPVTVEGLLANSMLLFDRLWAWHTRRSFRGQRSEYLEGDVFWKWPAAEYDERHGVPDVCVAFDRLIAGGQPGRPRKYT